MDDQAIDLEYLRMMIGWHQEAGRLLSPAELFTRPTRDELAQDDEEGSLVDRYGRRRVVYPATWIRAYLAEWAERWRALDRLGSRYLDKTWADVVTRGQARALSAALAAAQAYAAYPQGNLILVGPTGAGKTLLAALIHNHTPLPCIFQTSRQLVGEIFEGFKNGALRQMKVTLQTVPLLILDDLGAEKQETNEAIIGHLDDIIDFRYQWELPTVVTSNLPIRTPVSGGETLQGKFRRLVDRLIEDGQEYELVARTSYRDRQEAAR